MIPQLFPKLLNPDDRKSKALISSSLNNLTNEIINPKAKGTSIIETTKDKSDCIESGNKP